MIKIGTTNLANVLYLVSIPICLIYYVLTSYELIPPLLGGYYPYAFLFSLVLMLFFISLSYLRLSKIKLNAIDLTVIAFSIYGLVKIASDYSLGKYLDDNIRDSFSAIVYFISIYVVFKYVDLESKYVLFLQVLSLMIFVVGTAMQLSSGAIVLIISQSNNLIASYQYIAVFFILVSLPLSLSIDKKSFKYTLYLLSIVFLFFNGARTEFVSYLVSVFIIEYLSSKNKMVFLVFLFLLTLLFVFIYVGVSERFDLGNNRVVDLIVNLNNTSSGNARAVLAEQGYGFIDGNIFWGGFDGYSKGEYIHNVFSVWVDLGIIGFLLYQIMLVVAFSSFLLMYKAGFIYDDKFKLALSIFIPAFLFVLISKSYGYLLVSASIGMLSSLQYRLYFRLPRFFKV
ncbi:hypothetical protein AAEH84_17130 [Shewanella indica]|uniref:hypothetical protein n=1 Tax=Shewanella indica TaxID=768528 RepID=UPI00313DA781